MASLVDFVRRRPFAVGAAIVIAVVTAHLLAPEQPSVLLDGFIHSLHGPGFAVVALAVFAVIGPLRPPKYRYLLAAVVAGGIGVLAELAQIPGSRDAQLGDLVVDGVGIIGGLAAISILDPALGLARAQRIFAGIVAAMALAAAFLPSFWYLHAMVAQHRAFPELLSFEHRWERSIYSQTEDRRPEIVPAPSGWPADGERAAYLREAGRWGILIRIHNSSDWRGYSGFSFVAVSTSDTEHAIAVDILDGGGDGNGTMRYRTRIDVGVAPARHVIAFADMFPVDESGSLDLERVDTLVLSATSHGSDVSILVDDFRLER